MNIPFIFSFYLSNFALFQSFKNSYLRAFENLKVSVSNFLICNLVITTVFAVSVYSSIGFSERCQHI